jgi:negative regulator of sigma E activity
MNEERDSQLSAMFDGELPAAECELLARRLSKDEPLRASWARYALIGAALRGEPGGVAVAAKVSAALAADAGQSPGAMSKGNGTPKLRRGAAWQKWLQPIAGAGIAASVAALSITWLQTRVVATTTADASISSPAVALQRVANNEQLSTGELVLGSVAPPLQGQKRGTGEPASYTVPVPARGHNALAGAQLANYVFAHSEFAAPLNRRSVLSALVATEAETADAAAGTVPPQAPVAAAAGGRP